MTLERKGEGGEKVSWEAQAMEGGAGEEGKEEKIIKNENKNKKEKSGNSDGKNEGKRNGGVLSLKRAAMVAAALAIGFFAYAPLESALFGSSGMRVTMLEGMRIESYGEPLAGLEAVLSRKPQIVRQELYNASDPRNSVVIVIASEVVRSIAMANQNVSSYAITAEVNDSSAPSGFVGCSANNSNCGAPTVTVRFGSCNCLRIDRGGGLLTIEGDGQFLQGNVVRVGGLIGLAYDGIRNKTAGMA
jgi:hypothetical protein